MITDAQAEAVCPSRGFLRTYLDYAKQITDAPLGSSLFAGLAVLSAMPPTDFGQEWYGGGKLGAPIWVLVYGETGDGRKTAALDAANAILEEIAPEKVIPGGGSREGFLDEMTRHGGHGLTTFGEFGDFLSHARGDGYAEKIKPLLTRAWDGKSLEEPLAKKTRGPKTPRLSIQAGSTLHYLEAYLSPRDMGGGFFNRFVAIGATSSREYNSPRDAYFKAERAAAVDALRELSRFSRAGECVGMAMDARLEWERWAASLRRQRKALGQEAYEATARIEANAMKIAQLLSFQTGYACRYEQWFLTLEEIQTAIAFGDLLLQSSKDLIAGLAPSEEMRRRRQVLLTIQADSWVPYARALSECKLTKRVFDGIVDTLLAEELVERGVGPGGQFLLRQVTPGWLETPYLQLGDPSVSVIRTTPKW